MTIKNDLVDFMKVFKEEFQEETLQKLLEKLYGKYLELSLRMNFLKNPWTYPENGAKKYL